MFGELPSLFGRAFAVGFFLPAAVILSAALGVARAFGHASIIETLLTKDLAVGVAVATIAMWLFAVTLMALNRSIIRLLEGYGRFNPFALIAFVQLGAFEKLSKDVEEMKEAKAGRETISSGILATYASKRRQLAENFPDESKWVLPTRFGNVIRAFEVYPRVVYGLDAIPGWPRLIAVVPEHFRTLIDDAKSQMDFFVNVWAGGCLVFGLYTFLAVWNLATWTFFVPYLWIPMVTLVVAYLSAQWARSAAGEWGVLLISAFDMYRRELCANLGLRLPGSIEAEREMWTTLCQAMVYRHSESMSRLNPLRIGLREENKS